MSTANDLADRLETSYTTFADYVAQLSPEQWRERCGNHPTIRMGDEDEHRPVGTVAHHTAVALPFLVGMVRAIVAGEEIVPPQRDRAAQHARDYADPDQGATVELLRRNAADAGRFLRGLSDDDLARSGRTLAGELTAGEAVSRVLLGHVSMHEGSIKATLGHPV